MTRHAELVSREHADERVHRGRADERVVFVDAGAMRFVGEHRVVGDRDLPRDVERLLDVAADDDDLGAVFFSATPPARADRVRSSAVDVQCKTALRSWGAALQLYIKDNKGMLPGPLWAVVENAPANNRQLPYFLLPYLGNGVKYKKVPDDFLCAGWVRERASETAPFWQLVRVPKRAGGGGIRPFGYPDDANEPLPLRCNTLDQLVDIRTAVALRDIDKGVASTSPKTRPRSAPQRVVLRLARGYPIGPVTAAPRLRPHSPRRTVPRSISRLHVVAITIVSWFGFPGLVLAADSPADKNKLPPVDPARVAQIGAWLSSRPVHFTPSFDDRAWWEALNALPAAAEVLEVAHKAAREPTPELPDSLYYEFRETGARAPYERPANLRTERLAAFLMAAGLSDDTRWLALFETELAAILDEPNWASPAHTVRTRRTRESAYDFVDLAATARAWTLASADYLFGDRLRPETRARLRREIRARVFTPWLERVRAGDRREFWWMNNGNNWNAVCNAGVVGAALLLVDDPAERAEFVAGYEAFAPFFLAGFSDDGFCHEGIGYWVYGFGHYVLGSELVRLNTAGRVDLLASPKVARIAAFARDWEIAAQRFPTFGDAWSKTGIASWLAPFVASRFDAPAASDNVVRLQQQHGLGTQVHAILFGLAHRPAENAAARSRGLPPRSWFPEGGALVARSVPAERGLSVAFKGGHNDQPHNHNDLGSFMVLKDGVPALVDLGADDYVKDTFGPRRYTSGVMNSFGHPVPRVAGQLQKTGAEARAVTVRTEFTDERDLWEIDLTSAYDVPELERLTRTFIFTRVGGGRLEIVDRVRFSSPQTFGGALVLHAKQRREAVGDAGFRVVSGAAAVDVAYEAVGGELVLTEELILGIVPGRRPKGTRVGLDLRDPVREAEIRLVVTPAADGARR